MLDQSGLLQGVRKKLLGECRVIAAGQIPRPQKPSTEPRIGQIVR
jgi:hypothetical protein